MAHPHPSLFERFWEISYRTLRNLKITNPFWTYCPNFHYGPELPEPGECSTSMGWVYGQGLHEGYVRIPWHGDTEPVVDVPCSCSICGKSTDSGIRVVHVGKEIGFGTNRHYIDWWKTHHDDPGVSSEGFDTPEEVYKEQL